MPETFIRVEGLMEMPGIERHGPSSASAATMCHVQRTTMVPFFITKGDGLLQWGKVVFKGSNGPPGVALVWIVLPT